jgi:hypothetical protein
MWEIYGKYMGNDGNIYILYIYGIIMGVEVRQLEFEHPKLVWHDGDTTLMGLWMRAGNGVVEFLTIFEAVIWGRCEALCHASNELGHIHHVAYHVSGGFEST